jgi:DNA-binding CsgD family transcriptional regulator
MSFERHLQALGVDLATAFERLDVPVALADPAGVLLWQNAAAVALVGDLRGTRFASIVPDYREQSRAGLARTTTGHNPVSEAGIVIRDAAGVRRRIETVNIALTNGDGVVGVLGIVTAVAPGAAHSPHRLTPRLLETLRLLADGCSTDEIAARLGVTRETARNYIRRLLRALDVHSRLEAVVRGREAGLI